MPRPTPGNGARPWFAAATLADDHVRACGPELLHAVSPGPQASDPSLTIAVQTLLPIELASQQLEVALGLFLQKRPSYVASLTLAGAAEEIFARVLEERGKTTALRHWYANKRINQSCREAPLSWAQHAAEENHARNASKHLWRSSTEEIALDFQEAAAMMLHRACTNHEWLGHHKTWRMRRFEAWFWRWAT